MGYLKFIRGSAQESLPVSNIWEFNWDWTEILKLYEEGGKGKIYCMGQRELTNYSTE